MRSHWIQMNPHAIYLKKVGSLNTETQTQRGEGHIAGLSL